jgi:hypothetical protein
VAIQSGSKSPSRRALLAGALGGLGAWAASAIARPRPAAAEGQAVVVGGEYQDATSATRIGSGSTVVSPAVLQGETASSGIAVRGFSQQGTGLYGDSNSGTGTYAYSTHGRGLVAESQFSDALQAQAFDAGTAVKGTANSGFAFRGSGRIRFDRVSGVATITAGNTRKVITPGVNVTSGTFVLLTPRVKLSGRDLWFTTDAANNKFTIHMSSSRSSATSVAWLLLG